MTRTRRSESGVPLESLPVERPYSLEQLRDHDWMPE
ncbi:MAG TPA: DUF29 domain-containing protein [Aurantimonas sp.]|uniref:DUF29 domain-containing protein n=1 Tax=Aurantimonas marianensis TaxID=2920428 RepID=A0A9X2H426_9HYPH|nr:DUF29 domain-containing protein [Aurantimonas marianensis]MCP3053821.1 DUF29 domain-containing protein [Aurantimonas marianensis]